MLYFTLAGIILYLNYLLFREEESPDDDIVFRWKK